MGAHTSPLKISHQNHQNLFEHTHTLASNIFNVPFFFVIAVSYVFFDENGEMKMESKDDDDDGGDYKLLVILASTLGVVNFVWFVGLTIVIMRRRRNAKLLGGQAAGFNNFKT